MALGRQILRDQFTVENTQRLNGALESGDGDNFGSELEIPLKKAIAILERNLPDVGFQPERGLFVQLEEVLEGEADPRRQREIKTIANSLRDYFRHADPDKPWSNNGKIRLDFSSDKSSGFLTLLPPRGDGNIPTINSVSEVLNNSRVAYGIDEHVIDRALRAVREERDIVWRALVARGKPAVAHPPRRVRHSTEVIDKALLRKDVGTVESRLTPMWEPVKEGQEIGSLMEPEPGVPGTDVCGEPVEPAEGIAIDPGDDIICSDDGVLTAKASGYVITDGSRIDIVPLYVMEHPAPGSVEDFAFSGTVLVRGDLQGPGKIECDDLIVVGNCEQVKILSRNDVFVTGGIVGHHQTEIDADGGVYCSFVSEARLSALGEIVATNAIMNSEVFSGDIIRVTSEKGMIAGGSLHSLREVVVATIGSEFGMLTEIVVGKDFLASSRLQDISAKIEAHEENLRRIEWLKKELEKSRVPVEQLPPQKQEIYIGILRKEENSHAEMKCLIRRKKTLDKRLTEFLAASVQVLNSLYPPSKVQILDAISEIREKLDAVTLKYGKRGVIVSDSTARDSGEEEK